MTIMQEKETKDKKQSVIDVLQLLFPGYKPLFTPMSLVLNPTNGGESKTIDENNFENL